MPQHALNRTRLGIPILEAHPFRDGFQAVTFDGQDTALDQHLVQVDETIQPLVFGEHLIRALLNRLPPDSTRGNLQWPGPSTGVPPQSFICGQIRGQFGESIGMVDSCTGGCCDELVNVVLTSRDVPP